MIGEAKLPSEILNPKEGDMIFKACHIHIYTKCEMCGKPRWARTDKDCKPYYSLCFSCARKHPNTPEIKEHKKQAHIKAIADPMKRTRIENGLKQRWIHNESKEKQKIAMLNKWNEPDYKDNTVKAILNALIQSPNSYEMILIDMLNTYFPDEWDFVGNGEFVVGGVNPDFKHKTNNWIIEHFGEFHHNKRNRYLKYHQTYKGRMDILNRKGYKTLILWQHEVDVLSKEELANMIGCYFGCKIKGGLLSPPHNLRLL